MLSYLFSFFNYFTAKPEDNDEDTEEFLAEQLVELEASAGALEDNPTEEVTGPVIPRSAVCFQKTGVIMYLEEDYILIDGNLFFDTTSCSLKFYLNDKVLYLGYKDSNDSVIVVIEHVIIGEVDCRQERNVIIKDSDLKFTLDDVEGTFIPMKGDWLEMKCTVQFDENKPSDISASQVLEVTSFKALRSKIKSAVVTQWSGEEGVCDRQIYFNKQCLQNGMEPKVGTKVMVEAIESNQGAYTWRVIKLISLDDNKVEPSIPESIEDEVTLSIEKEKNIDFPYPLQFNVDFNKTAKITATLTNNSNQVYLMTKWLILSKKRDSQIHVQPFISRPMKLHPKQSFNFTITCEPKFPGIARECFIILFRGFQIKRFIEVNVVNNDLFSKGDNSDMKTQREKIEVMKKIRKNDTQFVRGIRPVKPPNFIPVRLGGFPIPERIWSAVLGDSEQTVYSNEYDKILNRIETNLPCVTQDLNITNYIDRWHTLLYMEEIQANISMRAHDTPKAFLIRCQEYLAIEIKGLSEKRPSLIKGDRAIVQDIWDTSATKYEGYIHAIRGDLVLMKFNQHFHEIYNGSDVSLEFHFNRSIYRRAHQAINLAISNLGAEILFPTKVLTRPPQVTPEALNKIQWLNNKLNDSQKAAITNILKGESRPLPYCIFGPPGTGKTVTVIETIIQILTLLPDSRILVATPSNSAANLITERLIQFRKAFSDSMIRLIANYLLDSDNIPEEIKPFCATLDIAREDTSKPKYMVKDGINLNCQTSFIGRHRVTIGTCYCIGTLAQMGLPKGHFTHIIVDEAGQATEPEIMIPLTFTDKQNGQIILAGDPMQLGPVVMSKYCKEFGLDESYLSRLLETFPYHRDYDAFKDGYNKKLVTKLNDNYRSLDEVLKLPSEMFYDASLLARLDRTESWIQKTLKIISEVFETDPETGGVFVYGIRGCNMRAEDSPSWYNPQEASMVALTTCKLYKRDVSVDDIGIITPYIAQIKYLRLLFDAMGLPQPKIGTVEEFQGQERPIILISTVRSTESLVQDDIRHALGFVKSPKRLNVALTRAQVAVILFCNPHLLCTDALWSKVIAQAVKDDKYMGCDLPSVYNALCNKNSDL
ncbi:AAA domain-containing protein [Phthorimaea operculella]|nr:AAA domain-containing protein [Phthorimaea operculella]